GWSLPRAPDGPPLGDEYELRTTGALGLPLPRGRDLVERDAVDVEDDVAGGDVADEAVVVLGQLVLGYGEVRVTEERKVLEAHGRRGELRGRARRLAQVDDRRARDRGLDRGGHRCAPDRIEHVARPLAPERVLECRNEIVGVE